MPKKMKATTVKSSAVERKIKKPVEKKVKKEKMKKIPKEGKLSTQLKDIWQALDLSNKFHNTQITMIRNYITLPWYKRIFCSFPDFLNINIGTVMKKQEENAGKTSKTLPSN